MTNILKFQKNPSFVIIDHGYSIYIDSDVKLDNSTLKLSVKEYKPIDNNILIKTIKELKDNDDIMHRYTDPSSTRYLYSISKVNKDKIKEISKFLNFNMPEDNNTDVRNLIIDLPTVKVIDYTDKSYAIFVTDLDIINKLKEEKSILYNRNLTGINFVKTPGYILSKKNKKKDEILALLNDNLKNYENEIVLMEPSPLGSQRFKIQGNPDYIKSKLDDLNEDYPDKVNLSDEVKVNDTYKTIIVNISD